MAGPLTARAKLEKDQSSSSLSRRRPRLLSRNQCKSSFKEQTCIAAGKGLLPSLNQSGSFKQSHLTATNIAPNGRKNCARIKSPTALSAIRIKFSIATACAMSDPLCHHSLYNLDALWVRIEA